MAEENEKTIPQDTASVTEDSSPTTAAGTPPAAANAAPGPEPPGSKPAGSRAVKSAQLGQLLGTTPEPPSKADLDLILDIEVPISVELGRTEMSIAEVLELGPGSIVELQKMASDPVDLLVNNKLIAHGEVVVVDENFGIRISSVVNPRERVKSLG